MKMSQQLSTSCTECKDSFLDFMENTVSSVYSVYKKMALSNNLEMIVSNKNRPEVGQFRFRLYLFLIFAVM
jgi:hypothetical protein